MVLPFESDVWGFAPPADPNKHVDESSKSGRTRGSTILANMAGGSDVYRDARLAYVRSQQRGCRGGGGRGRRRGRRGALSLRGAFYLHIDPCVSRVAVALSYPLGSKTPLWSEPS